jgi:3-phosphoglycerate kinase
MNLIHKVDHLLLGGAMIFTFYKAKGYSIGKSMYDKQYVMNAKLLGNNEKITLPKDVVVADDKDNPSTIITYETKKHTIIFNRTRSRKRNNKRIQKNTRTAKQ